MVYTGSNLFSVSPEKKGFFLGRKKVSEDRVRTFECSGDSSIGTCSHDGSGILV